MCQLRLFLRRIWVFGPFSTRMQTADYTARPFAVLFLKYLGGKTTWPRIQISARRGLEAGEAVEKGGKRRQKVLL